MNLRELIEELEEVLSAVESSGTATDCEVLLATQPSWPLAFALDTITLDSSDEGKPVLWLAEGGHPHGRSPYAPKHAWDGGEVEADSESQSC